MGQKGSKKPDLYVTDNETNCNLPDEEVKKFVGRAREYTAVDVIVSGPTPAGIQNAGSCLLIAFVKRGGPTTERVG